MNYNNLYASNGANTSFNSLGDAAIKNGQMLQEMQDARESKVTGGYDAQISKSALAGQQAYAQLDANYAPIIEDARATRERNMGRIDQYGNSMRQDLAIKNQQALASARQSAIQRGLGSTTIQDSFVRGQNFDNTRQQLSLEDQLLQNRISTDSNLSGTYQSALQNRAAGLNQQTNQNISNDNGLASNRLNYIGSVPINNYFNDAANLYSQGLTQQNANQQAQLDRNQQMAIAAMNQQQAASNSYSSSPPVKGLNQYQPGSLGFFNSQPKQSTFTYRR